PASLGSRKSRDAVKGAVDVPVVAESDVIRNKAHVNARGTETHHGAMVGDGFEIAVNLDAGCSADDAAAGVVDDGAIGRTEVHTVYISLYIAVVEQTVVVTGAVDAISLQGYDIVATPDSHVVEVIEDIVTIP